jgi:hypothetical protein
MDAKRGESRQVRFPAHELPAVVHYRGSDYACSVLNLSRSGALLKGEIPWPEDETVSFALKVPRLDEFVELTGRVARVYQDDDDGGTCLALAYSELSGELRDRIEALLSRVIESRPAGDGIESLTPGTPPHEIRKALEAMPLPKRIALAARATPKERGFLVHDPHPQVLEALARNPNLAATETHKIVNAIHVASSTLQVLADDPRWAKDVELRIIIATHPRVPIPLAERLIRDMNVHALRKLLARPTLNPSLRTGIKRRIARGT